MKPSNISGPGTTTVEPSSINQTDKRNPYSAQASPLNRGNLHPVGKKRYDPIGDHVREQVRSIANSPFPILNAISQDSMKKKFISAWACVLGILVPKASGAKLVRISEEQEIYAVGAYIKRLAEEHADEIKKKNTPTPPPFSITTPIGYSLGILQVLGANALNSLAENISSVPQKGSDIHRVSEHRSESSTAMVPASSAHQTSLPFRKVYSDDKISPRQTRSVNQHKIRHDKKRNHQQTSSHEIDSADNSPSNDHDVIIVKLFDSDCVSQREHLSFNDVLRTIGQALHSPFKKMGEEWQVLYHHEIRGKGCPSAEEVEALRNTLDYFDQATNIITQLLPAAIPVRVLQHIVGPLLILIADDNDNVPFNMNLALEAHEELLGLAKQLFSIVPEENKKPLVEGNLENVGAFIPKGLSYENKELLVTVGDTKRRIYTDENDNYVLGMDLWTNLPQKRTVRFNPNTEEWDVLRSEVLMFPIVSGERVLISDIQKLRTTVRNSGNGKNYNTYHSADLIRDVLIKWGKIKPQDAVLIKNGIKNKQEFSTFTDNNRHIINDNQLLSIPAGDILLFVESSHPIEDPNTVRHAMLSLGNGRFAGVGNDVIFSELGPDKSIVTAEQLGAFQQSKLNNPGNLQFNLYAGRPKNMKSIFESSYKDAAVSLKDTFYGDKNALSVVAALARKGDIPTEFVDIVDAYISEATPLHYLFEEVKNWHGVEQLESVADVPDGSITVLYAPGQNAYTEGDFALRLSENEFYMPGKNSGDRVDGIMLSREDYLNKIRDEGLYVKQLSIDLNKHRVSTLLGKHSAFFLKGKTLFVRAHGRPMSVNYMSPFEMINIIKGLSIKKNINFSDKNKINTIELQSCFGAVGLPSSGKVISSLTDKTVIAYKGRFKLEGIKSGIVEGGVKKTYTPQTLSNVDKIGYKISSPVVDFIQRLQGLYTYLTQHGGRPSAARRRSKRSEERFNQLILEIGRLVLGQIELDDFLMSNDNYYTLRGDEVHEFHKRLSVRPGDNFEFIDMFLDVLFYSTEASNLLDEYVAEKLKIDNITTNFTLTDDNVPAVNPEVEDSVEYSQFPSVADVVASLNHALEPEGTTVPSGSFSHPKRWYEKGKKDDVYYEPNRRYYFVLKKEGKPYVNNWTFPSGIYDDENWIAAGPHKGTQDQPKYMNEYGKEGDIYLSEIGLYELKQESRPSEQDWALPADGQSNDYWQYVTPRAGLFITPRQWHDRVPGVKGDIYFSPKNNCYFMLKVNGTPAYRLWEFPDVGEENGHWKFAGSNKGTLAQPKSWGEYGKPGSIYHMHGFGYFSLATQGIPSVHNWQFPSQGQSNAHWNFICRRAGTFNDPKRSWDTGRKGDVYWSKESKYFFILKRDGSPLTNVWPFPLPGQDDENWISAGTHTGTLKEPKSRKEYGKAGTVYYDDLNNYYILRTAGRPDVERWGFPPMGTSDEHWQSMPQHAGTFTLPKRQTASGRRGDVYCNVDGKIFYVLMKDSIYSKPASFPISNTSNEAWKYAGTHQGTLDDPKPVEEYGKEGSIYLDQDAGYYALKVEGNPAENKWPLPNQGQSNEHWKFLFKGRSINLPKSAQQDGRPGDLYYSPKQNCFFTLQKRGNPERGRWNYPYHGQSNEQWTFLATLSGDFHSPKLFENDGKVGDIYYAPGESCFFRLKNAGVPRLRRWTYPRFGQSNENWEFINQRTGTYQNPKLMGDVGEPNEIYYCPVVNLYFIAKNHGVKFIECCPFPTDGGDNEHWIVAGSHQGSLAQPKNWAEHGQPGSIYYKNGHGYFSLLRQGRPSEHNWEFPPYGKSNDYWQPVGLQQGIFTHPRKETEYGVKGDIYFSSGQRAYFALKRDGNPSESGWLFPTKFKNDDNWVFAGMHKGTLANPKIGNEYGKVGSIYRNDFGYYVLMKEGHPVDEDWDYPARGQSNHYWQFLTERAGTFSDAKHFGDPGKVGDIYFSHVEGRYYITKKNGVPALHDWPLPSAQSDNEYWFDAGEHQGTMEDPKDEYEYGKIGSIYHCFGGYYLARKSGRPADGRWRWPQQGESDDVTYLSKHAGTYGDPKKEQHSGNRGDVYFSVDKESYFVLKTDMLSEKALQSFPTEEKDDKYWYYAGTHQGTLAYPKMASEYGIPGEIYKNNNCLYALRHFGRPTDAGMSFPHDGESNLYWKYVTRRADMVNVPLNWDDTGNKGDIYFSNAHQCFYTLKQPGNPARQRWPFPDKNKSNDNWQLYECRNGIFSRPKFPERGGQANDVYYSTALHCYFILKRDATPSDPNWKFPYEKQDSELWRYAGTHQGTFAHPKNKDEYGIVGSIYQDEAKGFFALKKAGIPSTEQWPFPSTDSDDDNWFFAGTHQGTLKQPKTWSEYGQAGSVYYDQDNGYFRLKADGRPADHLWYYA